MTITAARSAGPGPRGGFGDRNRIARFIGLFIVLLALATATTSFFVLTGQTAIEPSPTVVRNAGIINGLVVLCLVLVVA